MKDAYKSKSKGTTSFEPTNIRTEEISIDSFEQQSGVKKDRFSCVQCTHKINNR